MTRSELEAQLMIRGFTRSASKGQIIFLRRDKYIFVYVMYLANTSLAAYQFGGPTSEYMNPKTVIEELQKYDLRRV